MKFGHRISVSKNLTSKGDRIKIMTIWTGILLFVLGCAMGAIVGVTIRLTVLEEEEECEDE